MLGRGRGLHMLLHSGDEVDRLRSSLRIGLEEGGVALQGLSVAGSRDSGMWLSVSSVTTPAFGVVEVPGPMS